MTGNPRPDAADLTAIVTGAAGQDGYFLVARLLTEGATVHAIVRDVSTGGELATLTGADRLIVHSLDIADTDGYRRLVGEVHPDELYNLAGMSSVMRSFDDPTEAWRSNAAAVQGLLEVIRTESPATRFYQASSTDIFGSEPGGRVIHDESSAFRPQSPYAAAKAAAHVLCDAYRRAFDLRIAAGILSNHESSRRPASFLTGKVVTYVRQLRGVIETSGSTTAIEPLRVGNLAVRREWGHAPDYVDGMIRVCRQVSIRAQVAGAPPEPDMGSSYRDYVLGTGVQSAVWELIDRAFALAGVPLEWDRSSADPAAWTARLADSGQTSVVVDEALLRPADPETIGTDPSLARRELGWQPRADLDTFLSEMISPVQAGRPTFA